MRLTAAQPFSPGGRELTCLSALPRRGIARGGRRGRPLPARCADNHAWLNGHDVRAWRCHLSFQRALPTCYRTTYTPPYNPAGRLFAHAYPHYRGKRFSAVRRRTSPDTSLISMRHAGRPRVGPIASTILSLTLFGSWFAVRGWNRRACAHTTAPSGTSTALAFFRTTPLWLHITAALRAWIHLAARATALLFVLTWEVALFPFEPARAHLPCTLPTATSPS